MAPHTPPLKQKHARQPTRTRSIPTYLQHLRGRIFDLAPHQLNLATIDLMRRRNTRRRTP